MPLDAFLALGVIVLVAVLCAFSISAVIGIALGRRGLRAPDDPAAHLPTARHRHPVE